MHDIKIHICCTLYNITSTYSEKKGFWQMKESPTHKKGAVFH